MAKGSTIFRYFWAFGCINNVLYVVILSAAADIVGPNLPKSLVLLVDILPSFIVKLTAPFFIHRIPYRSRIAILVVLSCVGMILVSGRKLGVCIAGIVLASLSSGLGEITFLQLTHYYEEASLNGWSSGTGGAGLLGSASYLLLTSILKIPIGLSLALFSILPLGLLLFYRLERVESLDYTEYTNIESPTIEEVQFQPDFERAEENWKLIFQHFRNTCNKLASLVKPYMVPLSTVYFFEYLINQGVSPTLLFPLDDEHSHPFFFHKYRDIYVTYGTLYQLGVFISRSSGSFVRIRRLYLLSVLQGVNLALTVTQSWFYVSHSVWPIMLLIFYEGLLGGASYVNTFMNIIDEADPSEREFSLGAVSISDSFGTLLAAFAGIALEPKLCGHQVATGRPWCAVE